MLFCNILDQLVLNTGLLRKLGPAVDSSQHLFNDPVWCKYSNELYDIVINPDYG